MILADKIINLRKKNGWSQEQLAERLNVTRQSVSKWEGAQSIPELDKILQLSQIFGVTTDYLIKEEIEDEEYVEINSPSDSDITNIKKVSLADAQEFLSLREQSIRPFSLAASLMILAPIPLLLLTGASEYEVFNISEYLATAIGLIAIMILAAIGIGLIVKVSMRLKKFEFLEKETFETEYGVTGLVKEKKAVFENRYTTKLIIGITLCILSTVPLFIAIGFGEQENYMQMVSVGAILVILSIGVNFILRAVMKNNSYEQLLEEGEYTRSNKQKENVSGKIGSIYWPIIVAIYLGYSFITNDWGRSWLIWPIAALLFAPIAIISDSIARRKDK